MRLVFALLPQGLHLLLLEDDAWMVTNIARHWALGNGITADGVHPTNGFHPLYPLTFGAIPYLIAGNDLDVGFRANVIICALLNTLMLLPLYSLLRLVADRAIAIAGLTIIALNPFFIRISVNAMETSLALLLLLTMWWYALAKKPTSIVGGGMLGLLAGLAILARLDTMIAAGMLGLVIFWNETRQRTFPRVSLSYGIVTGLVLLPYFIRNLVTFGHLTPSSGRALSYMHSYQESFAFSSGLQLIAYQPAIDVTWAPAWVFVAGLLLVAWMFLTITPTQRRIITPMMLYTLAITFYYAYLQQQGRPRYYAGVGIVLVILLCAWLNTRKPSTNSTADSEPSSRSRFALSHILFSVPCNRYPIPCLPSLLTIFVIMLNTSLFINHIITLHHAPYLAQPSMYQAARWIAGNLPSDAYIAAQNSGVFQYYSERVVINIDGKLNHEIIPVLEQRTLDSYVREKGVDYIVDLDGVADYITFYSHTLSDAPAHKEVSSLGKLLIYGQLIAAKVGIGPPVTLDERTPTRILRPFSDVTRIVKQFPLPNDSSQAVTIYQLRDNFGEAP